MASSHAEVEFSGDASPRVRHSSARLAPVRRKAYSSPPRSADSWPGRAVTARTLPAGGSGASAGASGTISEAAAEVEVIGCSFVSG